jgi:hypothetical protein
VGLYTAEVLVVILQRSGGCSRRVCEYSVEVWWVDCRLKLGIVQRSGWYSAVERSCGYGSEVWWVQCRCLVGTMQRSGVYSVEVRWLHCTVWWVECCNLEGVVQRSDGHSADV